MSSFFSWGQFLWPAIICELFLHLFLRVLCNLRCRSASAWCRIQLMELAQPDLGACTGGRPHIPAGETLSVLLHSYMCPLCASSMSSTVRCTSPALFLWFLAMDFYDVYCIYLEVYRGQSSISNVIFYFFSRKFFYPSNLCLLYYVFNSFFFFVPSIVSPRRNPWFSHHFDLVAACLLVESSQSLAELWIAPAARLGLVV